MHNRVTSVVDLLLYISSSKLSQNVKVHAGGPLCKDAMEGWHRAAFG